MKKGAKGGSLKHTSNVPFLLPAPMLFIGALHPPYYPALKSLLESLDPSISVLQNPKKTEHGSPDFRLTRKRTIDFPVGWIEAKIPGEDLDKIARSDQLKRYYHLPNLILTDFLEFRWYTDGKPRLSASLGVLANGKCKFNADGQDAVEELLRGFLAHKTPAAKDSRDLARRMAQLAHFIREAILIAREHEPETGILHQQMDAFREALIPDLDEEQFADMYAQTIAYGLFAARCQPPSPGEKSGEKFTRERAAYLIPKTNPFLRKLFSVIAGPDLPDSILPYVDDLVSLLRDTDIGAIMADFGKRTAKEDPVVHFYEDFLQAYDPKLRELRGVYYTPEPVVSYIVRSIDYILKNQFSKPLGLADKDVLILDPACGTGTFLYFVIRHIYDTLCQHGQKGQWNSYVSENLLKRIFGFELLMAPYAVAHLKLGLLLQELGYKFESEERLGVYLTNTLEEAAKKSELFFAQWIADEANAASEIKRDKPIMVVLGNPPYSNFGRMNRGKWILDLLRDYKEGLGEKKLNLDDDYIKFIRFSQWRIDRTGYGILGFVSNSSYLDGPTHRAMRKSLMENFSTVHVLDLHGSSKRQETGPAGGPDENVFDIQQGVAISLFTKKLDTKKPHVFHADLWGSRGDKYAALLGSDLSSTPFAEILPESPMYFFFREASELKPEYSRDLRVDELFKIFGSGFNTDRDALCIDFDAKVLESRMRKFFAGDYDQAFREQYDLRPTTSYDPERRAKENSFHLDSILTCIYRPFDTRSVYYEPGFTSRPVFEVMKHMQAGNIALVAARQSKEAFGVLAVKYPCTHKIVTVYDRSSLFPLYSYPSASGRRNSHFLSGIQTPEPNFNESAVASLAKNLGISYLGLGEGDLRSAFGARNLFAYIYAVFYSTGFRERYAQLLKTDFPHVPPTSDKKLFAALAQSGAELISLHLMESLALSKFITKYEQSGDHEVKKVLYVEPNPKAGIKSGRAYINDAQYFEGVPKEVWEFHIGGYQVCEKWLKDRKGRKLSSDDIDHYQKIVVALAETIRIMAEIDSLIPGWPLP